VNWVRRHGLDLLIVAGAIGAGLEVATKRGGPGAPTTSLWFTVPAVALAVMALLGRRRWPFAAPAALWLVAAALSFVDGRLVTDTASLTAAGVAAAFLLGQVRDDVQLRIGLAVVVASAAIIVWNDPTHTAGDYVFTPALFAIAWLAGFALRERSAQAEAAEERAEQAAQLAVAEERTRIARELHDIVAHAVSVMVLQAGAVRHRLPAGDDEDALRDVERTGRMALTEMRRLLGAMRREGDEVELGPQPGLGELDPLLDAFRRAGLPVQLMVDGRAVGLPRALDLSAYRIIQEGLTNALKHADATRADVVVRYGARELQIDVRDNGRGPVASDGLGHGLVGIRERVRIYGGEMTTGTVNGGGFVLSARLPLEGAAQ
jgi:signal transduction histidine kinase